MSEKLTEKEELNGFLKEKIQEEVGDRIGKIEEKAAEREEKDAKLFEDNKVLKEQMEAAQGKIVNLNTNSAGPQTYIFKGMDPNHMSRNFKTVCSKEVGDEVAKMILKALTSANTGAYAIPVEYSSALLGLAELSSYALSRARVIRYPGNVMKIATKGTRASEDAQAFGTANTGASTTLGQLTFTIDKRIGSYESIYNDVLYQENFDVVGEWVEPAIAEAIGQAVDGEMMTKTEFTTDVAAGGTSGATFSGAIADGKITYSKLIDTEFAVEQERGLNPEWVMPRGVLKFIRKLVDDNGLPLWDRAMEGAAVNGGGGSLLGYPVHICGTSCLSATPANTAICAVFGDPRQYIIGINNEMIFEVNPYVQMKEGITQFIGHLTADGNIVAATAFSYIKRNDA